MPPTDQVRSATLLTRLRDLSVEASAQQLSLDGQLEARRTAIARALNADDYDNADALLDKLSADLDKERARAKAKADFDAAVGDLLKPKGAVATQLDEALASPQEVALTFEMLKQVLGVSEGGSGPAGEHFLAASREALDHVARLLSKVNNIVLDGWLEDCAPFVRTETDIQAFIALFQAVLQQYTALQAVKPSAEGA